MPRRVQDIIPAEKRSIREVSVSPRVAKPISRPKKPVIENQITLPKEVRAESIAEQKFDYNKDVSNIEINKADTPLKRIPITPPIITTKPKRNFLKWPLITVICLLIIAGMGYFASKHYAQATFTITPKIIPVSINSTYVAQGSADSVGLTYDVVTIKRSATTTVSSTNGPVTNTKAVGRVTFYNSYSNQSIRLIAGTRLSADNGLIYRLSSSIVIPGYTKSSNTIVPGKINANITADQAGQQYNIVQSDKMTDMKIVAYSGQPRYTTVYAKPISAISGGFSGVKKVISPAALASTTAKLKTEITEELSKDIKSLVKSDYIMYDNNFVNTFTSPVIGGTEANTATVSMEGIMYAIVLPRSKLIETFVGSQTIALFDSFEYTAPGLESLDVDITNIKDFSPTKKGALVFKAKGDMKIIGTIPVEEIKNKLKGLSLSKTQDIFKSYSPVIESGSGELAPPWASIPTDLNKIKVVIQEP